MGTSLLVILVIIIMVRSQSFNTYNTSCSIHQRGGPFDVAIATSLLGEVFEPPIHTIHLASRLFIWYKHNFCEFCHRAISPSYIFGVTSSCSKSIIHGFLFAECRQWRNDTQGWQALVPHICDPDSGHGFSNVGFH